MSIAVPKRAAAVMHVHGRVKERSLSAVVTVARGTKWERKFELPGPLAMVSGSPWKRFLWWASTPWRHARHRRAEAERAAYVRRIVKEGYVIPSQLIPS